MSKRIAYMAVSVMVLIALIGVVTASWATRAGGSNSNEQSRGNAPQVSAAKVAPKLVSIEPRADEWQEGDHSALAIPFKAGRTVRPEFSIPEPSPYEWQEGDHSSLMNLYKASVPGRAAIQEPSPDEWQSGEHYRPSE
jgi:hypothetical protein